MRTTGTATLVEYAPFIEETTSVKHSTKSVRTSMKDRVLADVKGRPSRGAYLKF
jgi:hypothetical protein